MRHDLERGSFVSLSWRGSSRTGQAGAACVIIPERLVRMGALR